MNIVNTPEEFLKIWYYRDPPEKKDYPKKYPCIVEVIDRDGGLGGGYMDYVITSIPNGMDPKTFLAGYTAGRKIND